jgi:DME family drug/metabolite transporter
VHIQSDPGSAHVTHPARSSRVGLLQISAAGVLWGTGGLAVQDIREHAPMSVLTISAYRMLIAAVVLGVALAAVGRLGDVVTLMRSRPGHAVLVGVSTAAYQALYFGAVVWAGVSVATVVSLGLAPLLLTLLEARRHRRPPHPGDLAVLATALCGLVLVSTAAGASGTGPHPWWGIIAAAGSGTAYALTTVVGEPLAQTTSPLALTTTTTAVGALALAPAGIVAGLTVGPLGSGDPVVLGTLAYLGVLTMALAYGLLYAGLRTAPASAAVIATLVEPVTAAVVAAAFLDERLGVWGWAGTGLVLAAVAGLGRRTPAPAVPPG